MAWKSSGTTAGLRGVIDANQAMALLDTVHHWACTRINRESGPSGYQLTVTHAGKRVCVVRRAFVDAVNEAVARLRDDGKRTRRKGQGFVPKLVG